MNPQKQLEAFAQSIYLVIKGRYFDDIDQEDGQEYVAKTIDWTNMFIDELEHELGPDGKLIDWWFARETNYTLGTAVEGTASTSIPVAVDRLLTDEMRTVQVSQDGIVASNWQVVHPKDIASRTDRITQDTCALVGTKLVFSRQFRDTENDGVITGDVMLKIPPLATNNLKALSIVRPGLLLKLGVAKNATLPDIVQGGLSPSYSAKFDALLAGAMARSVATSVAAEVQRDSFNNVRGFY